MGHACPCRKQASTADRLPPPPAPSAPALASLLPHLVCRGGKARALEAPGGREGGQVFVIWVGCHLCIVPRVEPVAVHSPPQRAQRGCRAAAGGKRWGGRHMSVSGCIGECLKVLEESPATWHGGCGVPASLEGVGRGQTAQGTLPNSCCCRTAFLPCCCPAASAAGAVGAALQPASPAVSSKCPPGGASAAACALCCRSLSMSDSSARCGLSHRGSYCTSVLAQMSACMGGNSRPPPPKTDRQ